jgi:hypothetical protein
MAPTDRQDRLPPAVSELSRRGEPHAGLPRGFTIADGQGGVLSLDLAAPNLDAFAEACRLLAKGPLPSGATMLIVRLEPDVYVLSYSAGAQGAGEVVAALIDESARRQRAV